MQHHEIVTVGMAKTAWLTGTAVPPAIGLLVAVTDGVSSISAPVGIGSGIIVGIAIPLLQMYFKDRAEARASHAESRRDANKIDLDKARLQVSLQATEIEWLRGQIDRISSRVSETSPKSEVIHASEGSPRSGNQPSGEVLPPR